jgi:hypothetical protein
MNGINLDQLISHLHFALLNFWYSLGNINFQILMDNNLQNIITWDLGKLNLIFYLLTFFGSYKTRQLLRLA